MKRFATRVAALLFGLSMVVSPATAPMATQAAGPSVSLSVTPVTWDIVGLDSNTPSSGPYRFPVGVKVCASGGDAAGPVNVHFAFTSANANINLRPGSLQDISLGSVANGACERAYFEAEVTRTTGVYDTFRRYVITATDGGSGATASSPTPRQLYVEHLISQNRNGIDSIKLDGTLVPAGGTMTMVVGETYDIELAGHTATQGYNQLESFITLSNTIFRVLSVKTVYSANTAASISDPHPSLYADACGWDADPGSPNYRSCIGGDAKAGGTVVTTYRVRILSGAGTSETLTSLLYDFSGSSFHYNADASTSFRIASIVGPESVTITKSFQPRAIAPGATSTLSLRIANPTGVAVDGVKVTDPLPAGMKVATPPATSVSAGCGAGTFNPAADDTSLSFANGALGPNGVCTLTVDVTVASAGTYANTTNTLKISDTVDTGNTGSDTLTVAAAQACVPGQTLARWSVPNATTANPPDTTGGIPTTQAPSVANAVAVANLPAETSLANSGSGDAKAWTAYGFKTDGQYLQFRVDTRKYSNVGIAFDMANPSVANGPTNLAVTASANGVGGTYQSLGSWSNPVAAFTNYSASASGKTSTTGDTYFRITPSGAQVNSNGGNVQLDNITLTGCLIAPTAPVLAKAFQSDPIRIGETSVLHFTLDNTATGNEALTGVAFSDTLPAGLEVANGSFSACGGTVTTIAATRVIALAGGSMASGGSCSFDVTVTGGGAGDDANVTGFLASTQTGTTTSYGHDTISVLAPPVAHKSFTPSAILKNDTTTLGFTIVNPNASTALTGVALADALPAGLTVTNGSATACGGTVTRTAPSSVALTGATIAAGGTCTYSVTATGTTAGTKDNTTAAVTSANGGTGNTAEATVVVSAPVAAVDLNKQISTDGGTWRKAVRVTAGADAWYRFSAYNAGDVPLTALAIDDDILAPVSCAWGGDGLPLAPGGTATCVLGPVAAGAGEVVNTATVAGTSTLGDTTSGPSSATSGTASLTLDKTVSEASYTAEGENLHYSYLVTNTGFYPLADPVAVTDDLAGAAACPAVDTAGDHDGWLDPGESVTCSATYPVTADDLTAGSITNHATATADGIDSNEDTATVERAVIPGPAMAITKDSLVTEITASGPVQYSIVVANTGNVALHNVAVTDALCTGLTLDSGDSGADLVLGVGETWTYSCSRTVTQADIDAGGNLSNTASASSDETAPTSASHDIPITQSPSFSIDKTTATTAATTAGQAIDYTITLANTGNRTLSGVTVDDPFCSASLAGPTGDTGSDSLLGVGETWAYTCSHIVTQHELNVGLDVSNTATADTNETTSQQDQVDVPVTQSPSLALVKTASTKTVTQAGDVVEYTISAHNDGNLDLTTVFINDPACDAAPAYQDGDTADPGVLNVGETWTWTCSHTMTQLEIDIALAGVGIFTNTVDVTTTQTGKITATKDVDVARASLEIAKSSTTTAITAAGQVDYTLTVTNTGTIDLTSIDVTDPDCSAPVYQSGDTGDDGRLGLDEAWVYTCSRMVTQAEVNAGGNLHNTATADSAETPSTTGSLDIPITAGPGLTIVKAADPTTIDAPGTIHYTITVRNTGTVDLTGVTVTDEFADGATYVSGDDGADEIMSPGEFWIFSASTSVSQAAIDAGNDIVNIAYVTTDQTAETSDEATTTVDQKPSLAVAKTSSTTSVTAAGQVVPYEITVANTGNVSLTGITVDDPACDAPPAYQSGDTGGDGVMGVGEAWAYTCARTVTQAELDAGGTLDNTATAGSDQTEPASADHSIDIAQDPGLSIAKTLTSSPYFTKVGDTLTYAYVVTNTGNVTIPGPIAVTDNRTTVSCPADTTLAPASSFTCTSTDTVTEADMAAGIVTNTASASGTFEESVVSTVEVAVSARAVIPPSTPPSASPDLPAAVGPGWGAIGALAAVGIGLLVAAIALAPVRRRRRNTR